MCGLFLPLLYIWTLTLAEVLLALRASLSLHPHLGWWAHSELLWLWYYLGSPDMVSNHMSQDDVLVPTTLVSYVCSHWRDTAEGNHAIACLHVSHLYLVGDIYSLSFSFLHMNGTWCILCLWFSNFVFICFVFCWKDCSGASVWERLLFLFQMHILHLVFSITFGVSRNTVATKYALFLTTIVLTVRGSFWFAQWTFCR